eukprot:TRINITY_DN4798_c0_g2_i1.p1 TRINITY_DN4798_c0_g2~~TRINITY_DN4798_c0_g2_i1.p1  ORF type:complete len:120 (+),score=0.52 TRINITY_DN4798_c0_g2_i1:117-476(+)
MSLSASASCWRTSGFVPMYKKAGQSLNRRLSAKNTHRRGKLLASSLDQILLAGGLRHCYEKVRTKPSGRIDLTSMISVVGTAMMPVLTLPFFLLIDFYASVAVLQLVLILLLTRSDLGN